LLDQLQDDELEAQFEERIEDWTSRGEHDWMVQGECAYCGERATLKDHVIPRAYLSPQSSRKRNGSSDPGFKVDCCSHCNAILGDRIFHSLVERKAFVYKRLKVKLRGHSSRVVWDEEEMAELGPNLRSSVEVHSAQKTVADRRLQYAAAPPAAKFLRQEEKWRNDFNDYEGEERVSQCRA
jgi:hypothetical protein